MKNLLLFICALLCTGVLQAQDLPVAGYIRDQHSAEVLPGATIWCATTATGAVANELGFYRLFLPRGKEVELHISFVGYQTRVLVLSPAQVQEGKLSVDLQAGVSLAEVRVLARSSTPENEGVFQLPRKAIAQLPAVLGERDLLKAFQFFPAVQRGTEGSTGLHVRGGSADQNLILLDGVPLYYVNHVGGWFSVFDEHAVNHAQLTASAFPAQYGGRLSSVLNVGMREGDKSKFHGGYNLGLLSAGAYVEGPLQKGKSSFLLSARRCNMDLISRALMLLSTEPMSAGYTFYDVNLKLNHQFTERHRLFFSLYTGDDLMFLKLQDKKEYSPGEPRSNRRLSTKWGNTLLNLRYNYLHSARLFSNLSVAYVKYRYRLADQMNHSDTAVNSSFGRDERFDSNIEDYSAKWLLNYSPTSWLDIAAGADVFLHRFQPGARRYSFTMAQQSLSRELLQASLRATETAFFVQSKWQLGPRLSADVGLRTVVYAADSTAFVSPEPRLKISYRPVPRVQVSANYTKMQQNLHQLSNASMGMAFDMWFPSTRRIRPQQAHQFGLSLVHSSPTENYSFSLEVYGKKLLHLVEFKEGFSFRNEAINWQDRVTQSGTGTAWGVECLAKKNAGRLTGWLAYTYSRNRRLFQDLNNGLEMPYLFDRPHNFSAVALWELNEQLSFGATFAFSSGHLITLPVGRLATISDGISAPYEDTTIDTDAYLYQGMNNYRLPPYHRLDISMQYKPAKRKGRVEWNFSVINLYNRKNPYLLFYQEHEGRMKMHKLTLFPLMPALGYMYKF